MAAPPVLRTPVVARDHHLLLAMLYLLVKQDYEQCDHAALVESETPITPNDVQRAIDAHQKAHDQAFEASCDRQRARFGSLGLSTDEARAAWLTETQTWPLIGPWVARYLGVRHVQCLEVTAHGAKQHEHPGHCHRSRLSSPPTKEVPPCDDSSS